MTIFSRFSAELFLSRLLVPLLFSSPSSPFPSPSFSVFGPNSTRFKMLCMMAMFVTVALDHRLSSSTFSPPPSPPLSSSSPHSSPNSFGLTSCVHLWSSPMCRSAAVRQPPSAEQELTVPGLSVSRPALAAAIRQRKKRQQSFSLIFQLLARGSFCSFIYGLCFFCVIASLRKLGSAQGLEGSIRCFCSFEGGPGGVFVSPQKLDTFLLILVVFWTLIEAIVPYFNGI